jgi:GH15 family glucan-1,4-alpha-glucosidase
MTPRDAGAVRSGGYLPIRDYALVGDCHGSALVGRDGSVDWCCLRRFDADPVFCRILDSDRGGFLSLAPLTKFSVARSYVDGTNILQTVFTTEESELVVTDFMPVGRRRGSGTHNYVDLVAPHWLVRIVEISRGDAIDVRIAYRPTLDFGRNRAHLKLEENAISVDRGPFLAHNATGFTLTDDLAEANVSLQRGQRLVLVVSAQRLDVGKALAQSDRYRAITTAFWREWLGYCRYRGPYAEHVRRSLLTIKLLIYAPSGALAASPTTSLPEEIGGVRNWDYRYCWLRDTAFALYALAAAGYGGEARRFSRYLPRVCAATAPELRIMYGIDGETDLEEETLDHLPGYRGSRPVRIGNAAFSQRQIDVYGEILDWALLFETLGGKLDADGRAMLAALADYVADHWHEPDHGLWEMRGPLLHHVHGKIMSWVALDRAIRLIGRNDRWERERDRIVAEVQSRGGGREHGYLIQAYDRPRADAALLLIVMTAFPAADSLLRNTIAAVESELRSRHFVYRYRSDDGVAGDEGAFLICSFWLVDAYLCIGRHAEAKELFERLLASANDLGLYAEEVQPADGAFLGNFPQAYTHLALIGSAAHLQLCEQRGGEALRGSYADRAKLMVAATLGWRAIWAAFRATWTVGRIFPSRESVLSLSEE